MVEEKVTDVRNRRKIQRFKEVTQEKKKGRRKKDEMRGTNLERC